MAAWRWHLGLGLGFTALALVMTWPLGSPGARVVPDMNDSFFNIWRLSWVAHQLVHQPAALFDANIFYPARHTLAYSDAMLLVGLAGAPFLWAGVPPAVVHNGLLIAALASSAWASAVLAHRLTGDRFAAVLAGVIVGFAPYRFAHIAHLELQWLMWMPLALLALHALVERPRPAAGLALGACLAAQLLCSIYYGVFLAVFAGVAWIALVVAHGLKPRLALSTAVAAIPLALVAAPYLAPYAASRAEHGPRSATEIALHSAQPADYLAVPPFNVLRGGGDLTEERALYPGAAAIGLAVFALVFARGRVRWVYLALAAFAFDASLGVHGLTFRVLQAALPPLGNLRASARFASLTLTALAMLAAIGAADLRARFASRAAGPAILVLAMALCVVEFWSRPPLRDATLQPDAGRPLAGDAARGHRAPRAAGAAAGPLVAPRDVAPGQVDQPLAAARERLQRVHPAGPTQHADRHGDVPRRELDRTPAPAVRRLRRRPPPELPRRRQLRPDDGVAPRRP